MHLANNGKGWPQGLVRDPLPSFPEAADLAQSLGPGESDYTDYDREITSEACQWIRRYPNRARNKPWTLFVSFVSLHYPLVAPQQFFDLYAQCKIPKPAGRSENERSHHPILRAMSNFSNYDGYFDSDTHVLARRNYYGLCSFLDDNVRQVLQALEDSAQINDTVIVYTSDHGEMLGNHGFWTKSVMYEDSVAAPMIAGQCIPTGVNNTPVSLTDMAATIETAVVGNKERSGTPWQGRPLQEFIDAPDRERPILSEYRDGGSPSSRETFTACLGAYVCLLP